jgi:hypothetical protein
VNLSANVRNCRFLRNWLVADVPRSTVHPIEALPPKGTDEVFRRVHLPGGLGCCNDPRSKCARASNPGEKMVSWSWRLNRKVKSDSIASRRCWRISSGGWRRVTFRVNIRREAHSMTDSISRTGSVHFWLQFSAVQATPEFCEEQTLTEGCATIWLDHF